VRRLRLKSSPPAAIAANAHTTRTSQMRLRMKYFDLSVGSG
jgi:hypothetical protein